MKQLIFLLASGIGVYILHAQEPQWNDINQKIVDLYSAGNYEDAILLARKNREIMERAPVPVKIVFYNNVAGAFLEADIVDSAIYYYKKAVQLSKTDSAKLITSLMNLREAYATIPDFAKALEINNKALKIASQLYPSTHPIIKDIKDAQAYLYIQTGKTDSAILIYRQLLQSANITEKPYYYKNMGIAMLNAGNDSAVIYLRKAVESYKNLLGPMHPETAETMYLLAKAMLKGGKPQQANALADTILMTYRQIFGDEENPEFARIYALKGNALLKLNNVQEAEKHFAKAVEIVFNFLGKDNPSALSLLREWEVPDEYFTKVR